MNKVEDILLRQIKDRRLLANVPDKQAIRKNKDRRGNRALEDYDDPMNFIISKNEGIRYEAHCEVKIKCRLIKQTIDKLYNEAERFETKNRLKYIVQGENKGKREALA